MAITKTNFINYSRCPRYAALDNLRKEKLMSDMSYQDYKDEELDDQKLEILHGIYEDEELLEDSTKELNPQMEAMMPYYKDVELEAGIIAEKYFTGEFRYAEKTEDQECFECVINNIKYLCYVDIYNSDKDKVNIIEVKATTTKKYLKMVAGKPNNKKCIWQKCGNILRLKDEIEGYNLLDEMTYEEFENEKNKLFNRFSDIGVYIFDIAVQRYIIEHDYKESNNEDALKNVKYYLAVLNSEYVYDGSGTYHEIDNQELITFLDVTKLTKEYQERVDICRQNIEKYLNNLDGKPCRLTKACCRKKPIECIYFKPVCGAFIPKYNSIFNYLNCHSFKPDGEDKSIETIDLINDGYVDMMDIPDSWIHSKKHEIQREAYLTGKPYIDKAKIKAGLNTLSYPIYHLDFETFPCPLPRFRGEKPYTQSPFEFSLHIEREPGKCDFDKDNFVFLAKTFDDEREDMVKAIVEHITDPKGTMFAQNYSFERSRLKELAEVFPEYKERLIQIADNSADLLWLVNTKKELYESIGFTKEESKLPNFYVKELSGSYSIKKTLPVFSDLSYANLDVKNGMEAVAAYAAYPNMSKEEYKLKYQALITYCKQDTWAMVVILDALRNLVK